MVRALQLLRRRHLWRRLAEVFVDECHGGAREAEAREALLYGTDTLSCEASEGLIFKFKGLFPTVESLVRLSPRFRRAMGEFVKDVPCPTCRGTRLRPVSSAARLFGRTLQDLTESPIAELRSWFDELTLTERDAEAAGEVTKEIRNRLRFLDDVGLGYLTLGRRAPTLSGGEAQRIRLASQIGSGLTGVLYVLDEPTIGLHQRDNRRLLDALQRLRDLGITLIVVEPPVHQCAFSARDVRVRDRSIRFGEEFARQRRALWRPCHPCQPRSSCLG